MFVEASGILVPILLIIILILLLVLIWLLWQRSGFLPDDGGDDGEPEERLAIEYFVRDQLILSGPNEDEIARAVARLEGLEIVLRPFALDESEQEEAAKYDQDMENSAGGESVARQAAGKLVLTHCDFACILFQIIANPNNLRVPEIAERINQFRDDAADPITRLAAR
jgi:hypothetical protein